MIFFSNSKNCSYEVVEQEDKEGSQPEEEGEW